MEIGVLLFTGTIEDYWRDKQKEQESWEITVRKLNRMYIVENEHYAGTGFTEKDAYQNLIDNMKAIQIELEKREKKRSKEHHKQHKKLWNY